MQNSYNLAHRNDDGLIHDLAKQGIAYVPFFPVGGFSPLQSSKLDRCGVATGHPHAGRAGMASSSSVEHLRENFKAASQQLSSEMIANLDSIGGGGEQ